MAATTARIEMETRVTSPDDFLTAALGAPCRALVLPCDTDALKLELELDAPAFVWAKLADKSDPMFAALTDIGFRIAVEEITYERPADTAAPGSTAPGFTVQKITVNEAAAHSRIAGEIGTLAFDNMTTSRFHLDPLFPDAVAGDIKKRWAMNFFAGMRGQEMYVAFDDAGRVAGFNQVLVTPGCKVIDLICTAAEYRRRGVARAIVAAMFAPGVKTRVGSQAGNRAADAFYKSLGFEPVSRAYCLHWHKGAHA